MLETRQFLTEPYVQRATIVKVEWNPTLAQQRVFWDPKPKYFWKLTLDSLLPKSNLDEGFSPPGSREGRLRGGCRCGGNGGTDFERWGGSYSAVNVVSDGKTVVDRCWSSLKDYQLSVTSYNLLLIHCLFDKCPLVLRLLERVQITHLYRHAIGVPYLERIRNNGQFATTRAEISWQHRNTEIASSFLSVSILAMCKGLVLSTIKSQIEDKCNVWAMELHYLEARIQGKSKRLATRYLYIVLSTNVGTHSIALDRLLNYRRRQMSNVKWYEGKTTVPLVLVTL